MGEGATTLRQIWVAKKIEAMTKTPSRARKPFDIP
jgi:hypothetical protein